MAVESPETTDTPNTDAAVEAATGATTVIPETSTTSAPATVVVQPLHPMPYHFPELRQDEPKTAVVVVPAPTPVAAPALPVDPHSVHDATKGYQPERDVCVRCGSSNLARGYVVDYGEKFRQVHFAPKRITLNRLNGLLNLMPFRSLAKLDAVACRDCGAVLLVVDPAELRRAERRRE